MIRYAVYEKIPSHCSIPDSIILGPYFSYEEAEKDQIKYGYNTDNYYIKEYHAEH